MAIMEQNNFEKNVQQKLDELKIPPSGSVWVNIEKRIGKKNKDRRVIFIIFFLILFLLSGGYWLFNSRENNQQNQPVGNLVKSDSKHTNKQDSSLSKSEIPSIANSENRDTASVTVKKSKTTPRQSIIFQDEPGNKERNRKQKKSLKEDAFKPKEKTGNSFHNERPDSKQTNNEENDFSLNNENDLPVKKPGVSEIENENQDSINIIQNKIIADSLLDQLKSEKVTKEIVAKNDSSLKKHTEKKQKHHWAFGITFSGGTSSLGEGLLGLDKSNSSYSQSLPNTPSNGGIGNGGYPSYTPSPINNSFAFIGGVFIEKNISAKSKVSIGISYKYFSLKNKIGNRIDPVLFQYLSSSSLFYSSSNTQSIYHNDFHYLELPVSIKFQLNNSKSFPLYWHAGVNISRLISSNALQFQSIPGFYYKDNSLFNKTQLGLNTGVSATLFAKQKIPVTIGPYFYYSPSRLAGKGLYQDKHFNFIGIRTEILFPKK